jgi:hypothetical protein
MNHQHPITNAAYKSLKTSLERFGNKLDVHHCMALYSLVDTLTNMAEGKIQGRWAFGLPTGTGKTRTIIEWATEVYKLNLPYTLAVSASRIEALCTLKRDMIENGIPEEKIGLLHDDAKASLKATADNDERPFMLITHQRIRSKKNNLSQYNTYKGQPRHLLLYDESLMTSDVQHFDFVELCACMAHAIERTKRDLRHATISNYLTECKQVIEYVYDHWDEAKQDIHLIKSPYIDPKVAEHYAREWDKEGTIAHFLRAANLDMRMLRSGKSAVVSYRIVVPQELKNIVILDASHPIRSLIHYDSTIQDAETLPSVRRSGVKSFKTLKQFDKVQLYRLRSYGGRNSMEKRFKDRTMAKEVVTVLKTIPETESVLFYVYKLNKPGGCDYTKILASEIEKAGIDLNAMTPDGKPRLTMQTWGNETSLNCYSHCSHVFLVGILHRDETELMGLYLGQVNDIHAEVNKTLADELQLSEKSHLAYQALSRGTCRTVSNGQAGSMKGYVVEVSPEIETTLSKVMPGVKWETWKSYFVPESEGLIAEWSQKVQRYLNGLDKTVTRVSSRAIKKALQAERLKPATWTLVVRSASEPHTSPKDSTGDYEVYQWKLEGQSLVKLTMEHFGFIKEVA